MRLFSNLHPLLRARFLYRCLSAPTPSPFLQTESRPLCDAGSAEDRVGGCPHGAAPHGREHGRSQEPRGGGTTDFPCCLCFSVCFLLFLGLFAARPSLRRVRCAPRPPYGLRVRATPPRVPLMLPTNTSMPCRGVLPCPQCSDFVPPRPPLPPPATLASSAPGPLLHRRGRADWAHQRSAG